MRVLGIETSCDETAAAVVTDGNELLSNVVSSSVDLHKAYGGVVPEIAARSHIEAMVPVVDSALSEAKVGWDDIDAIAVTRGPGLSGSLLIGVVTARALAIAKNKPLYGLNHVEAHIYANFITKSHVAGYKTPADAPALPLLALIVSGGHSHLIFLKKHGEYEVIGRTLDDAVGEAFDKVAKMIGLPYPGGPSIAKAAENGDANRYDFPVPQAPGAYNFSFSGLKTAVLRVAQSEVGRDYTLPSSALPALLSDKQKADIAASFQERALSILVDKLIEAITDTKPLSVVIGGGVAANQRLRQLLDEKIDLPLEYADIRLCTDNAAMIAAMAYYNKDIPKADPFNLDIDPSLSM
jgi:N6-L-threonylcarbamoyladenine synthase